MCMLPIKTSFQDLAGNGKSPVKLLIPVLFLILVSGAISVVLPGIFNSGVNSTLFGPRGLFHGKAFFFLPYFLICILFMIFSKFDSSKERLAVNITGVVFSLIPTFFLVYKACAPQGDALSGGILGIFAFVSAFFGYLLGWVLAKLVTTQRKTL